MYIQPELKLNNQLDSPSLSVFFLLGGSAIFLVFSVSISVFGGVEAFGLIPR